MAKAMKIIVCGDICGNLDTVYSRIRKLAKKGQHFDMLLCVGDFFGDDDHQWKEYKSEAKKAPIPTFLLGANHQKHNEHFNSGSNDGFEFCDNITFLGKKGVFSSASGLRIAYVSGVEAPSSVSPVPRHCFTSEDLDQLSQSLNVGGKDYKGVDILLTSSWPTRVSAYGNAPSNEKCKNCGSAILSQFVRASMPRYHFAGLEGVHYERAPYRNHLVLNEASRHVTRFVALAPVGNADKQKYLYAFAITPMSAMATSELCKQPEDTTECPFQKADTVMSQSVGSEQFRWNPEYDGKRKGGKRKSGNPDFNRSEKKQARPQDWKCWFCLGGEKVEKHLVASVGELCYVAMAKGGLTPQHVLITPIAHHSSSHDLPADTTLEAAKYKQALTTAFHSVGKSCVFFERNYRTDHMQIQVVPVPLDMSCDVIKRALYDLADKQVDRQGGPAPLQLTELPKKTDIKQIVQAGAPFFHIELPDGSRLFHRIQRFFPLQFGREALCATSVLDLPARINWRDCTLSRDQEVKTAAEFREFFSKFDFTMEDDDDDDE